MHVPESGTKYSAETVPIEGDISSFTDRLFIFICLTNEEYFSKLFFQRHKQLRSQFPGSRSLPPHGRIIPAVAVAVLGRPLSRLPGRRVILADSDRGRRSVPALK
jgi:hypothetical protein